MEWVMDKKKGSSYNLAETFQMVTMCLQCLHVDAPTVLLCIIKQATRKNLQFRESIISLICFSLVLVPKLLYLAVVCCNKGL